MRKVLRNKRGEGYIDVAVAVLVIVFVLVFAVSIFQMITLKQDMKYMCKELVEVATVTGKVGTEVEQRYRELCAETGITPTVSFSAVYYETSSGKVQLGDTITCHLTYNATLQGFGDFKLPFDITVTESGLSRIYWK